MTINNQPNLKALLCTVQEELRHTLLDEDTQVLQRVLHLLPVCHGQQPPSSPLSSEQVACQPVALAGEEVDQESCLCIWLQSGDFGRGGR